jgi:hypothetical protein
LFSSSCSQSPHFGHAQLRELGTGAPGPTKAQHLTAELISDSGTITPAGKSRVALLLALEPGWHAGWGFQLQSSGFVVSMTFLLFFMALSLAGMFDLGLTLTSTGDGLTGRSGYAGSFKGSRFTFCSLTAVDSLRSYSCSRHREKAEM